ncbi:hypothetical protein GGI04_002922 [Coemansia thaxteri]|nr:hypothetical protein GGI04_002922 [Coemansia thaxteri]
MDLSGLRKKKSESSGHRSATAGGGRLPFSVKLSRPQANWQDNWVLGDYAKNEARTKHRQLIVLDLNGTLIKRGPRGKDGSRAGYARPHLTEFLQFILKHFAVMVWSSAQPYSVNNMLQCFMNEQQKRFVRVWDRRFCDLDGFYHGKTRTTKDLLKITGGYSLADSPHRDVYGTYKGYLGIAPEVKDHWTLENMMLVDDSETKAALQRDNHLHISTFEDLRHDDELLHLQRYLQVYIDSRDQFPDLVSYLKQRPWSEFPRSL